MDVCGASRSFCSQQLFGQCVRERHSYAVFGVVDRHARLGVDATAPDDSVCEIRSTQGCLPRRLALRTRLVAPGSGCVLPGHDMNPSDNAVIFAFKSCTPQGCAISTPLSSSSFRSCCGSFTPNALASLRGTCCRCRHASWFVGRGGSAECSSADAVIAFTLSRRLDCRPMLCWWRRRGSTRSAACGATSPRGPGSCTICGGPTTVCLRERVRVVVSPTTSPTQARSNCLRAPASRRAWRNDCCSTSKTSWPTKPSG